jgi:predicted nucleotidyltransferase
MERSKAEMPFNMPVRLLNSSVLKWPDQSTVDQAARSCAAAEVKNYPELVKLRYFGSYARGDAGAGSDLDLIAIVEKAWEPFYRRSLTWNLNTLLVQAELIVYTREEWERLRKHDGRYAQMLKRETVWICSRSKD